MAIFVNGNARENVVTASRPLRSYGLAAMAVLSLAACETPKQSTIAIDTSVQPGSTSVDFANATTLYKSVCGDTAPTFSGASAVLAKLPFKQSSTTGTYFHQNLNLSFKVSPSNNGPVCSMVFASKESAGALGIALAVQLGSADLGVDPASGTVTSAGPAGTTFTFRPTAQFNGEQMFAAYLQK